MRRITSSWIINNDAFNIAKTNGRDKPLYLIWPYWGHIFKDYIRYNLYRRNNHINEDIIVEALTK